MVDYWLSIYDPNIVDLKVLNLLRMTGSGLLLRLFLESSLIRCLTSRIEEVNFESFNAKD